MSVTDPGVCDCGGCADGHEDCPPCDCTPHSTSGALPAGPCPEAIEQDIAYTCVLPMGHTGLHKFQADSAAAWAKERAALEAQLEQLQRALRLYALECRACIGTGLVFDGSTEWPDKENGYPCPECNWAHTALARAGREAGGGV